jgi:hypothetical protein
LNDTIQKTIIWSWGQRSRSHKGHYGTWHTALWSCIHIPNIIDLSRKTKNVMARTRKYYLKNNYLTLRSKVKVPQRSLRYATHRLMVMHPHTKYNWPIWKAKQVMVRTSFAEKKRKQKQKWKRKIKSDLNNMSPFVRRGDIISDNFILVSSAYEFSDNFILVSIAIEFSDNLIIVPTLTVQCLF